LRELVPLPSIRPQDYSAFLRLDGSDLPGSYELWLNHLMQQKRERERVGYIVREVDVYPDEFARFCQSQKVAADAFNLLRFADEKAFRRAN
jgi:hypothetical protein